MDTGASLTIINHSTLRKLQTKNPKLIILPTQVKLRTYSGELINPSGLVEVRIKYKSQEIVHKVLIADGSKPCLLGRDLLSVIKLDWEEIFKVVPDPYMINWNCY